MCRQLQQLCPTQQQNHWTNGTVRLTTFDVKAEGKVQGPGSRISKEEFHQILVNTQIRNVMEAGTVQLQVAAKASRIETDKTAALVTGTSR